MQLTLKVNQGEGDYEVSTNLYTIASGRIGHIGEPYVPIQGANIAWLLANGFITETKNTKPKSATIETAGTEGSQE